MVGGLISCKLSKLAESWLVFGMSLLVLLTSLYLNFFWTPAPYTDVELVKGEMVSDTDYQLTANFKKNACVFQRMTVIGSATGITEFLDYRNVDPTMSYTYDRDVGDQTLEIIIELERDFYDWIEVRTRHDCNGKSVDKVFIHLKEVP